MARISYVDRESVPEAYREQFDTHLEISLPDVEAYENVQETNVAGGSRNIYRLFGHFPVFLESHREHLSLMWETFDIDPRQRELALMAGAREMGSEYEWQHHVPVALDEGVTVEELRAISAGEFDAFDPEEALLLEYASRFVRRDIDDELHGRMAERYDDAALMALSTLLGFYVFLGYTLDALDVDLEDPFVGWDLPGF
ncbi:carboxymuconolactone decarboxylase family protein [Halorarius litoreus]|uniref:carboxymuconolactone decarboxylase family protein n=1 Tax=Halorarius litoreus TaxID=2962676 RepID=UPI0020CBDB08|nr:carboxymuconolactone decarboxylase family protein [Halorarius litoreus]